MPSINYDVWGYTASGVVIPSVLLGSPAMLSVGTLRIIMLNVIVL